MFACPIVVKTNLTQKYFGQRELLLFSRVERGERGNTITQKLLSMICWTKQINHLISSLKISCILWFSGFGRSGVQRFTDSGVQGFRGLLNQEFRGSGVQGFTDSGVLEFMGWFRSSGVQGFMGSGIQGFWDSEFWEFNGSGAQSSEPKT